MRVQNVLLVAAGLLSRANVRAAVRKFAPEPCVKTLLQHEYIYAKELVLWTLLLLFAVVAALKKARVNLFQKLASKTLALACNAGIV